MGDASRRVRTWRPRPHAQVALVCFPWAGGNALAFRPWAASFPPEVEVAAAEYPGRSTREAEAPQGDVGALVDGLPDARELLRSRPFVVLGYSLGALVAYEWLRRLARTGGPRPLHFFACARRAPHLPGRHPPLHALPRAQLVDALRRRFDAIPDALLGEPELLERFVVPLCADLRAVETYEYLPGEPLDCPISAFGGRDDLDVSEPELAAWAAHTRGPLRAELLDAGHFFLGEPRLRAAVLEACAQAVSSDISSAGVARR